MLTKLEQRQIFHAAKETWANISSLMLQFFLNFIRQIPLHPRLVSNTTCMYPSYCVDKSMRGTTWSTCCTSHIDYDFPFCHRSLFQAPSLNLVPLSMCLPIILHLHSSILYLNIILHLLVVIQNFSLYLLIKKDTVQNLEDHKVYNSQNSPMLGC